MKTRVFLSVVTLAEIRYGIERMPPGSRRKRLAEWLEQELPLRFEGRIIGVDATIADVCGKVVAHGEDRGKRMEVMDAFLAATAEVHQLTIVTAKYIGLRDRHTEHSQSLGMTLEIPTLWSHRMECGFRDAEKDPTHNMRRKQGYHPEGTRLRV